MTGDSANIGPADPTLRKEQERGFAAIAKLVEQAESIAICAHTSPDGDALGSVLALASIIEANWDGKRVVRLLADDAPVPRIYQFLPGSELMLRPCAHEGDPDLFIAVDLSQKDRLNDAAAICDRARSVAIMDHHPTQEPFGDACVIRHEAAAAGVIISEFALWLGVELDADMAQNLMCAIVTDTGRFQYQNVDS